MTGDIAVIICFVCGMFLALIIFLVDRHITRKRFDINQKEWDEYSKGMTRSEKNKVYFEFCIEQKVKHGWNCIYPPRIGGGRIIAILHYAGVYEDEILIEADDLDELGNIVLTECEHRGWETKNSWFEVVEE